MGNTFELTKQEAKIINLMTEGYTYKQIADKTNSTLKIVSTNVTRIKRNHGCRSSVQLVAKLLRSMYE